MRAFNRVATTVSPLNMMLAIDLVYFLYQAKEASLRLLKRFISNEGIITQYVKQKTKFIT